MSKTHPQHKQFFHFHPSKRHLNHHFFTLNPVNFSVAFQTFPLLSIHQFFPLNHGQTRPPITFHSSTVSLLSCQTPNQHFSSSNCHTYNSHIHLNITYSTSTVTCVIVLTCQLSHFYRIHSIIISHPSALTNFSNTSTPTVLIHQLSHFHPRNTSIIWFP